MLRALDPQQAWEAEQDRKSRLLREAHPKACGWVCRELVWAADQFIYTPVGRQADTARARAAGDEIRSVIAGYHWFTDWGRDTMISLEGLTLTTGRAGRSRLHSAHLRPLHQGWVDSQHVSRRGKRRALSHGRCDTLVLSRLPALFANYAATDATVERTVAKFVDIVDHHLRGTRFKIHVDPGGRSFGAGAGRISIDMDGCQGRWLGGDSAAGQSGGDQRALVQRVAPFGGMAAAGQTALMRRTGSPVTRSGRDSRLTGGFGIQSGVICMMSSMAPMAMRPLLPSQPAVCVLAGSSGAR